MRNKIYTCGKMTGLSYEEQMKWRNEFKKYLCEYIDLYGYGNITRDIVIIAPPNYYYNDCKPSNQREIQEVSPVCFGVHTGTSEPWKDRCALRHRSRERSPTKTGRGIPQDRDQFKPDRKALK